MPDEPLKSLLARQAKERAELENLLDSTREARAEAMAGARMGPTPIGEKLNRHLEKQKAMKELILLDKQKLSALDQKHAAERATIERKGSEVGEKVIDMVALQKAAIALALASKDKPQGPEAGKQTGPTRDFNELARD